MSTRTLRCQEVFNCTVEVLFDALKTPSAIRTWWAAARVVLIARPGGTFAVAWGDDEDDPEYMGAATLAEYDPPRRIVLADFTYYAKTGPLGFEADLSVEFNVRPSGQESVLEIVHRGIPDIPEANEYYEGCQIGWRTCLSHLQDYLQQDHQP